MSMTPLAPNSGQITTSQTSPVGTPPENPMVAGLHYQLDGNNTVIATYIWDAVTQSWTAIPMGDSNTSEGLVAGWYGPHNAKHLAPVPTEVSLYCVMTPRFSVAAVSASPIPFEVHDIASGTPVLVASGLFPADASFADASECSLADANGNSVSTFLFTPSQNAPVTHFTVTPIDGHASMPSDGETFMMHLTQVY